MNHEATEPTRSTVFDASQVLTEIGDGVDWSLARSGDLNCNLVRLDPGHDIGDHVNHDLDVVIIVIAGSGTIEIDGISSSLRPNVLADAPKGSSRRIEAGPDGLGYFTVHRRRTLGITKRRTGADRR